ncbi:MAG: DUF1244 domain-containing protein [Hydrotalea sp.]|nr:DUF1244 domain-containing protein [Hydrotalea sp.]
MTKPTDKSQDKAAAPLNDEIAARVLARLINHLQTRTDVQNIDLMNLAGFCRNCLSKWYQEEMAASGGDISTASAKKLIYGMDYDEWKKKYQKEATADQLDKMKQTHQH